MNGRYIDLLGVYTFKLILNGSEIYIADTANCTFTRTGGQVTTPDFGTGSTFIDILPDSGYPEYAEHGDLWWILDREISEWDIFVIQAIDECAPDFQSFVSGAYCLANDVFVSIENDLFDLTTHWKFWISVLGDLTNVNVTIVYFLPHPFDGSCTDGCTSGGVSIRLQPRPTLY